MIELRRALHGSSNGTFFRALGAAWKTARTEGRDYLYFAEWDELWAIAERDGIIAVYEGSWRFAHPLGNALLRLWRAMKAARADGVSEYHFWMRWDAMIDRERAATPSTHHRTANARDNGRDRNANNGPRRVEESDDLFTVTHD